MSIGNSFHDNWALYEKMLRSALNEGYAIVSAEEWALSADSWAGKRVLALRHDVEDDPASAVKMSAIEKRLGVSSTYFFRWSSVQPAAVAVILANGCTVGLHYETLTRYAVTRGLHRKEQVTPEVISQCREELKNEVQHFKVLVGRDIGGAPHGHRWNRRLHAPNETLLLGHDLRELGLLYTIDTPHTKGKLDRRLWEDRGVWNLCRKFHTVLSSHPQSMLLNAHPHLWGMRPASVARRALQQLGFAVRHPLAGLSVDCGILSWYRYHAHKNSREATEP